MTIALLLIVLVGIGPLLPLLVSDLVGLHTEPGSLVTVLPVWCFYTLPLAAVSFVIWSAIAVMRWLA